MAAANFLFIFMSLPREIIELVVRYLGIFKGIAVLQLKGWQSILCQEIPFVGTICEDLEIYHRREPNVFIDRCAREGHLDIIKWLYAHGDSCSTGAMDWAASYGHLEVVKWLHYNRTEGCTTEAMDRAARNGHLEIVKWLHKNRTEGCTTEAIDSAASSGHLEIVKWLHFNRTEGCTTEAMDRAAIKGHLDVVKWLHSNRNEGCTIIPLKGFFWNENSEIVEILKKNVRF